MHFHIGPYRYEAESGVSNMIPYKLGRYHLAFQLCIARSQIFAIVCEKPRRRDVNIFAQNLGISGDPCNERSIFNFVKWQVMSKFFRVVVGPLLQEETVFFRDTHGSARYCSTEGNWRKGEFN